MKYLKRLAIGIVLIIGAGIAYLYYPARNQREQIPIQVLNQVPVPIKNPIVGSNDNIQGYGIKLVLCPADFVDGFDRGFQKWIVVFENLKIGDFFSCEMMRTFPSTKEDTGVFIPVCTHSKGCTFLSESNLTQSDASVDLSTSQCISIVSAKGFLPGEKITLRAKVSGSDDCDTISFYPRPIVLCDSAGEELAGAELVSLDPASYIVHFAYNSKNPITRIYSVSGKERLDQFLLQDSEMMMSYFPGVLGGKGGFSCLRCTYLNGTTYELTFPWGKELDSYWVGSK
jgi:hypothetical protein